MLPVFSKDIDGVFTRKRTAFLYFKFNFFFVDSMVFRFKVIKTHAPPSSTKRGFSN